MIEKIIDLENGIVDIDKLNKLELNELRTIREEIRLISNSTPHFVLEKSNDSYDFIKDDEMQAIKSIEPILNELKKKAEKSKVTGFDALWSHVNIAISINKKRLKIIKNT